MARSIAITRLASSRIQDTLRLAVVTACALALIAADQVLPF